MNQYKFEEMKEEYLKDLADIYNHYILNSTATFHAKELSSDEMRDIVFTGNPRFKSYAIFDGFTICGYCILAQFKKREAYDCTAELTVYLRPEYIGKGLGSLSIKHMESIEAQNGFHALLAIICGENADSIRLFERHGYEKCAHYKEVGMKFGRLLDVVSYQKII
jgi:L-amino acid N-acyltransferase YncA